MSVEITNTYTTQLFMSLVTYLRNPQMLVKLVAFYQYIDVIMPNCVKTNEDLLS